MPERLNFTLDGKPVTATEGQTILEAADAAGVWIPRLCHLTGVEPGGSCRLCTVLANGRAVSACTQPVAEGLLVETETEELCVYRRTLVEMMLVEGNHFCMVCEKAGDCELQAMAYRFEIAAPTLPYAFSDREVDASHPDILLDLNRCIQCGRCVRASIAWDGKRLFGFVGRGWDRHLAVNAEGGLGSTEAAGGDRFLDACPVGALLRRGTAYRRPLGKRTFDDRLIGAGVPGEE